MHAVTTANLASTIALHGPSLLGRQAVIPPAALQDYWVASRARSGRWHRILAVYNQYAQSGDSIGMRSWWETHTAVIEEVLTSEILTRVYAALGAGIDADVSEAEVSPVVHSIYVSHLEARNRVLRMLITPMGASTESISRLNRLRQTTERWTDLLIGQIVAVFPDAISYGNVLERTSGFADEVADLSDRARQTSCWLMAAAMQDALSRLASGHAVCSAENQRICDSVLVCLRPDLFDACGSMQSLWMYRLKYLASETDNVLSTLLDSKPENSVLDGYEAIRSPQFHKRYR